MMMMMNILWIPMPWNSLVQDNKKGKRGESEIYREDEFFIKFFNPPKFEEEEIGVVAMLCLKTLMVKIIYFLGL